MNRCSVNVQSVDVNQEEIECNGMSNNNTRQNNCDRRHRFDSMKVKGKLEKVKDEGVVRFFPANWNGIGLQLSGKLKQIKKESKMRKIDDVIIISSDARWNAKNKMTMTNE